MDKIQVTARFTAEGKVIPSAFTAQGKTIAVHDVGRQWEDEEGKHILVMDSQSKAYHLLLTREDLNWYRVRDISSPPIPT